MYTSEFEKWWKMCEYHQPGSAPSYAKFLAWEAWRIGREKLHEEMQSCRLQPQTERKSQSCLSSTR